MSTTEHEEQPEPTVDDAIAKVGELARVAADIAAAPGTAIAPTGVGHLDGEGIQRPVSQQWPAMGR